jgi:hypothetical protein
LVKGLKRALCPQPEQVLTALKFFVFVTEIEGLIIPFHFYRSFIALFESIRIRRVCSKPSPAENYQGKGDREFYIAFPETHEGLFLCGKN